MLLTASLALVRSHLRQQPPVPHQGESTGGGEQGDQKPDAVSDEEALWKPQTEQPGLHWRQHLQSELRSTTP